MLFTGDYSPSGRYETIVINKSATIFGKLKDDIQNADISFVNLESLYVLQILV